MRSELLTRSGPECVAELPAMKKWPRTEVPSERNSDPPVRAFSTRNADALGSTEDTPDMLPLGLQADCHGVRLRNCAGLRVFSRENARGGLCGGWGVSHLRTVPTDA